MLSDARYEDLHAVLSSCAETTRRQRPRSAKETQADLSTLMIDILIVVKWKRLVCKILLCGIDIFASAIAVIKKHPRIDSCSKEKGSFSITLKRCKKKLEFYSSWALENWDYENIKDTILFWVDSWALHGDDDKVELDSASQPLFI